jgi:1-acyl-sn-glycerol-3-phosphate acyltransferase
MMIAFVFLVGSIPLLIAEWIIGKFDMDLKSRSSLAIVNWIFRTSLWVAGAKVTYLGEENVPRDRAVFYVANHRSIFDILLTYVRVPRPTGYVSKKEIKAIPLLRDWMHNLHCQFLDRHNIKEGMKTILVCIEKVKSGISICIFPEGTRNKVADTFLPFHDASFKVAEKSDCPIQPIAITNSAAIFEDHYPKVKKTHVIVEYLPPIYISNLAAEERKRLGAYVQGKISEAYFRNKALVS